MRRQWSHATALTPALVDARSRATAACEMVWRKARADSDFKAFAKAFRPVLDLTREVAAAKADAFGLRPYDALLDEYEPGGRAARVDTLFAELGARKSVGSGKSVYVRVDLGGRRLLNKNKEQAQ